MDSLDIHHLKECVIALQLELTAKKEDLMLKGSSRSELENGQYLALDISFTHNDLLSGNILIPLDYFENDGCDEMKFIDYEYAGYNARAFDLANHFCG